MKLTVFGLTMSSSWGNGHATLWRALCRALVHDGHRVVFFERDAPYYAQARDLVALKGCDLHIYREWSDVAPFARRELASSDVGMITSYCPDGRDAASLVFDTRPPVCAFYDLDTPVTLERLARGEEVTYVPREGLGEFDTVLSYTGGRALEALTTALGARSVAPLYGSVDPQVHVPAAPVERYRADLSYLGTYAEDRQTTVEALFVEPANVLTNKRFLLGGSLYPQSFPWQKNIWHISHVPPPEHPAFFSSSSVTLNATRASMAAMGYCPSGRLFEAAACGVPILSDAWEGLEQFFSPGNEILIAKTSQEALDVLRLEPGALRDIAARARERTLDEHSSTHRAREMIALLESGRTRKPADAARASGVADGRLAEAGT